MLLINYIQFSGKTAQCFVRLTSHNKEWAGKRRLEALTKGSLFRCWVLSNSRHGNKDVYYFGVESGNDIRYVTSPNNNGINAQFVLKNEGTHPSSVKIKNQEEKNDPRAFYYPLDRNTGRLVLAYNGLYAGYDEQTGAAVQKDEPGDVWHVCFTTEWQSV